MSQASVESYEKSTISPFPEMVSSPVLLFSSHLLGVPHVPLTISASADTERLVPRTNRVRTWENNADDDDDEFIPDQWQVTVTAKITVMIPGRADPLVRETTVNGMTRFVTGADLENSRHQAVKQACFQAAKAAVIQVTERW